MCQSQESSKRGATYSSISAVPGNLAEESAVEEERFLAAALFGLSGTPTGVSVLLRHPDAVHGAPASGAKP